MIKQHKRLVFIGSVESHCSLHSNLFCVQPFTKKAITRAKTKLKKKKKKEIKAEVEGGGGGEELPTPPRLKEICVVKQQPQEQPHCNRILYKNIFRSINY